ncbi:MAG: hypothetical protein IKA99_06560 [Clostridia bacterium]|nr:hypothetical protein [Clostridia bacterium]
MRIVKIISIIFWIITIVIFVVSVGLACSTKFTVTDYIGLIFNCLNVIVLTAFNLAWITEKKK